MDRECEHTESERRCSSNVRNASAAEAHCSANGCVGEGHAEAYGQAQGEKGVSRHVCVGAEQLLSFVS
eukprot:4803833-Prymnesium_polylepis.1